MELKYCGVLIDKGGKTRSNRTFMELKLLTQFLKLSRSMF